MGSHWERKSTAVRWRSSDSSGSSSPVADGGWWTERQRERKEEERRQARFATRDLKGTRSSAVAGSRDRRNRSGEQVTWTAVTA